MATTLFAVPGTKRTELDAILKEDRIARQSQKIRDATTLGGKAGELFVLIDGSEEAVKAADELLARIGTRLSSPEQADVRRRLQEEDDAASAGMGLFFTE